MRHSKTAHPVEPEHPMRVKLKKTIHDIDVAINKVLGNIYVERAIGDSWLSKINDSERLLNHPSCRNKEPVQMLLEIAISSYGKSRELQDEYNRKWGVLNGYRVEIGEALNKLKDPAPENDELQHRLNLLGAKKNVAVIEGQPTWDDEDETVRNLQNTLFAIEALVSLQKELTS